MLTTTIWPTSACCFAAGAGGRRFSSSGRGKEPVHASSHRIDGDLEYDDLFIFDEVGWNFEPSELSAAFGLVQLEKLPENLATRKRNFARLSEHFSHRPDVFVLPRTRTELDTAWHMFPVLIRPESGVRRSEFQQHMESHGVDTRMVWTGNVTRQPAFRSVAFRVPAAGLPNADRVMEQGLVLPSNHALATTTSTTSGRSQRGISHDRRTAEGSAHTDFGGRARRR